MRAAQDFDAFYADRLRDPEATDDRAAANVEATCKSLVTVRMKRPGARWKHTTGDEVLQLRALQLSDRWAPAVQRAAKPLAKPVQIAAGVCAAKSTKTAPVTGGQRARAAA